MTREFNAQEIENIIRMGDKIRAAAGLGGIALHEATHDDETNLSLGSPAIGQALSADIVAGWFAQDAQPIELYNRLSLPLNKEDTSLNMRWSPKGLFVVSSKISPALTVPHEFDLLAVRPEETGMVETVRASQGTALHVRVQPSEPFFSYQEKGPGIINQWLDRYLASDKPH